MPTVSMDYRAMYSCTGADCTTAISNTQTITVEGNPSININGATSICTGASITLTAILTGNVTCDFEWQESLAGTGSWTNTGSNSNKLNVSPTANMDYRVIYNCTDNGCDDSTSDTHTVTLADDPGISISGGTTICPDSSTILTAILSCGTGTCTIQWQQSPAGENNWSNTGGNSNSLDVTPVASMDYRAMYSCTGNGCGNATSNMETVIIGDETKPSLSCPENVDVAMDADKCGAVVSWTAPTATDNCDAPFTATQTMGDASGSLFAESIQTIEYTATDAANNEETCIFTVTVQADAQKPNLTCPDNVNVAMDAGKCGAVVTWTAPTATDNCDSPFTATQTMGDDSGSLFTEGTQTIEFTATDAANNSKTCTSTITVQSDIEKPVPLCKSNTPVTLTPEGNYTIQETDVFNNGSDNCGTVNYVSADPTTVSCTDIGNNVSVTVTANDGNGNTATCTASVTVAAPICTTGTRTWTGLVSTDWNNPCNWNPIWVPTIDDDVIIPDVVNDPLLSGTMIAASKSVTVEANAQLSILSGGSLAIDGSTDDGLLNRGIVDNYGTINIGAVDVIGGQGVENRGTLNNHPNAFLYIDQTVSDGLVNFDNAIFNNEAIIELGSNKVIGNYGLFNLGTFNNKPNAYIKVDSTSIDGVRNQGDFINEDSIIIGSAGSIGGVGIYNMRGEFNNLTGGVIQIDNTVGAGIENHMNYFPSPLSTFNNQALIQIGSYGNIGGAGIENGEVFNNQAGGVIYIDRSLSGIFNDQTNNIEFNNNAKIYIGTIGTINFNGIYNEGVFNNKADSIFIDHTGSDGIFNNFGGNFSNEAFMSIGANAGVGRIGIKNEWEFTNKAGEIHIEQVDSNGIVNGSDANFFNNEFCAELYVNGSLHNLKPFTNNGVLSFNTSDTHTNTDVFTNNGLLSLVQGDTFSNIVNNEIIITPTTDDCSLMDTAFILVASLDFNILGVFTDENITQSAGTYDVGLNNFIPLISLGQHTLYVEVEDPDNGCTRIVPWEVILKDNTPPVPSCNSTTVQLDADRSYTLLEADVLIGGSDDCGTINFVSVSPETVFCLDRGNTVTVEVTVNDGNGNMATCEAMITVADDVNPCCTPTGIIYVDENTPNDDSGFDWDNAFANLQDALFLASICPNTTEIWVAAGTYYPTTGTDRMAAFVLQNGIAIYGGFAGGETSLSERDWKNNISMLSGDIGTLSDSTDNSYHVVYNNGGGINATAILDGFTITEGNADDLGDDEKGGGIYNEDTSPTIRNCHIMGNHASYYGDIKGNEYWELEEGHKKKHYAIVLFKNRNT